MLLQLWAIFVGLSLIMIIIGLTKPKESAQALIGFSFLFLLSLVVLGNNLEYKTGYIEEYVYGDYYDDYHYDNYNGSPSPAFGLNLFHTERTDVYTTWDDTTGVFNTHIVGYFMAVASLIGFVGVLVGLKGGWKDE